MSANFEIKDTKQFPGRTGSGSIPNSPIPYRNSPSSSLNGDDSVDAVPPPVAKSGTIAGINVGTNVGPVNGIRTISTAHNSDTLGIRRGVELSPLKGLNAEPLRRF